MDRRRFVGALWAGVGAVLARRFPTSATADVFVERWSWAMGQSVHVMVFAGSEQQGLDGCAAALAELRRVEERLTLFDDASDLCELNRHAGRKPMHVDRDLRAVLALGDGYKRQSGGAFDVAVEPLMRAWGFHRPRSTAPTATELAEARQAVAAAVVELDGDVARLPSAHTQLDFGSIGVGYGIDRALAILSGRGFTRAFIDVSGDVAALGAPPGELGWLVEIADPERRAATVAQTRLRDAALSTAANTESTVRYGSLIVGHVMDPATGWPAHALKQASVVARTAVAADALSTAMLVAGKEPVGVQRSFAVRASGPARPVFPP
ncbi:MAG TPA: FAD:protein FMN transferase [Gemmatimonadales bacterium]|nr:FAD:protein FMN transferase [Gemmatimonadales bacterium]